MNKKIIAGILAGTMLAGCGAANIPGGTGISRSGGSENLSGNVERINVSYSEDDLKEGWTGNLSAASFDLMMHVLESEKSGENVLISPTSIMMAFGMTENGAHGNTLSEMESVINGGLSVSEMNPAMYALAERFESSGDVMWNVANSVWFRDDGRYEVVPEFAQAAKSWYDADVWKAAFDEGTVGDINSWVSEETKGMIDEIISDIPDETRMYLINAMAFEGKWMVEYEPEDICEDLIFTNYDGSTSKVTMLRSTEASYIEPGNGIGFIRPYMGGEYSFVGILPDEGITVEDYIRELAESGYDFSETVRNPRSYSGDIIVTMPEFKTEYKADMVDVLKDMGINSAFDGLTADLSGLMRPVDDSVNEIWIDKVIHKTFIEVDREGTRAAAVTAIGVDACGAEPVSDPPMYITLDRPFVYAVVDNETGLPVFLGCVNSL